MLRLLRLISYPQLRASWGRTALVVGGIATGVALIVSINVINTSVLANFRRIIEMLAGPANLEVTLGLGEIGFPEHHLAAIRADAGVAAAIPLIRGTVALADRPNEALQLIGVDLTAENDLDRYQIHMTTDRREASMALLTPNSLFVTTRYAADNGLHVGSTLRLATPSGVQELTVRGLVETEGLAAALAGQLVLMDLPAAQILLGKEQRLDQVDLVVRSDADVEAVASRLRHVLPPSLTVAPPDVRWQHYQAVFASFQAMLSGLSTLCLVAGVFIVYNTTSTAIGYRLPVFVELRLMGAPGARLFWLLMAESTVLGTFGTVLGLILGTIQGWLLRGNIADSLGIIFQLRFPVEQLAIDPWQLAAIAAGGIGATAIASLAPARQLATVDPLEALREGKLVAAPGFSSRQLVLGWGILVGLSVIALLAEWHFKSIVWGNVGSTLWNSSVIVIAVPLLRSLGRILSTVLGRLFRAEGRVAWEGLYRATMRTGLTVAAIALVLTVAITVAALVLSSRRSIGNYVEGFLSGDLVVSAVSTEGGWLETPIAAKAADGLRDIPGIASIEMGRALPGQLFRGQRISILALTPGAMDERRFPAGWFVEGDPSHAPALLQHGEGVAISTGLSDRQDLHVGDTIELDAPGGRFTTPIVAVVPDYISDRGSIILVRSLFTRWWNDTNVSRINLYLEPGASLDTVRRTVVERLAAGYRLKVLPIRETRDYHEEYVGRAFALTDSIQLLIMIVTVAGIFDLLLSAIAERRHELALWRVIGADQAAVRRAVTIESATLGLLGATLGLVVGCLTGLIWVKINFRYLLGYYLEFHFPWLSTIWFISLTVGMTLIAGAWAATYATRQSILEGIRAD